MDEKTLRGLSDGQRMALITHEYDELYRALDAHVRAWILGKRCDCYRRLSILECNHQIVDFQKHYGKRIKRLHDCVEADAEEKALRYLDATRTER